MFLFERQTYAFYAAFSKKLSRHHQFPRQSRHPAPALHPYKIHPRCPAPHGQFRELAPQRLRQHYTAEGIGDEKPGRTNGGRIGDVQGSDLVCRVGQQLQNFGYRGRFRCGYHPHVHLPAMGIRAVLVRYGEAHAVFARQEPGKYRVFDPDYLSCSSAVAWRSDKDVRTSVIRSTNSSKMSAIS